MNKEDLIARVAKGAGVSKSSASTTVETVIGEITRTLKKGDKVTFVGFGTFHVSKRKARTGRNPRTGEPIQIAARRVVRFTAGKGLKDAVK